MSNTEIEVVAAAWFAKREAEGWTPERQSELDAWLEQSTAHRIAFLRVRETWKRVGELDSLTTDRAPGAIPDRGTWVWRSLPQETPRSTVAVALRAWSHRIGRPAAAAMAAAVLVAVGLTSWYVADQGTSYRTEVGQVRSVPLEDGSHVTLDTGSRIEVAVRTDERRIDLISGDAYFEVAKDPARPFVAIIGGAKVSDKIEVVENLMKVADTMLIGGGMAYTFLKSQGLPIGKSLVEEDKLDLARKILADAKAKNFKLLLPVDHVVAPAFKADAPATVVSVGNTPAEQMGLDIGPQTVAAYAAEISRAKTILWNGPMGVFEMPAFAAGTLAIAQAVAAATGAGATSIVGGGDSVAAVQQSGVAGAISHISTGGGASLEFLGGAKLPGVEALTEK